MQKLYLVVIVLLMAGILISCQSKASENVALENPSTTSEAYPAPQAQSQAYPQPEQSSLPALYPDLKDGDQIEWVQLLGLLNNGEVAQILAASAPNLTVVLKDGRTFVVIEPVAGALADAIKLCGDRCQLVEIK